MVLYIGLFGIRSAKCFVQTTGAVIAGTRTVTVLWQTRVDIGVSHDEVALTPSTRPFAVDDRLVHKWRTIYKLVACFETKRFFSRE